MELLSNQQMAFLSHIKHKFKDIFQEKKTAIGYKKTDSKSSH